jgi:hypothetical protein
MLLAILPRLLRGFFVPGSRGMDVITIASSRPPNGGRLRYSYVVTRSRPYLC